MGLRPRFGEKLDDGGFVRTVLSRAVRVLLFDGNGGKLVKITTFAIFAGVRCEVKGQRVAWRAEMDPPKQQFPDGVESSLLGFRPKELRVASAEDVGHWFGQHSVVLDEAA